MEAIGRLAGGVAHDFNNLLTIVFGNADILKERSLPGDSDEIVAEILRAAESAASLTQQLLAFSRRQVLTPTVVSLNDLVVTAMPLLARLIGEEIELVTECDPAAGGVQADAGQLQQVLLNLGTNARDAMPAGGRLTVVTSVCLVDERQARDHPGLTPGSYYALSVADTGIGMDPDVKARVFEPFFTTKALGRDTGLGMATVYGIVKQSGGYISVESEPDKGTTFSVLLPQVPVEATRANDDPGESPAGHRCILVVEDEHSVRRVVCSRLRRAGYTIVEAANGPAALEAAVGMDQLDLLLTDVVMPQMDGRTLAARLTVLRPHLRVLYMTGYSGDANVAREIRERRRSLLQKPFSTPGLLNAVRSALDEPEEGA